MHQVYLDRMRSILAAIFLLTTAAFAQSATSAQPEKGRDLRALYVEDQRDRGIGLADDGESMLPKEQADKLPSFRMDTEMPKRDEARRERARTLLGSSGCTAQDYYYAAFIFQHSQAAEDYLFAHILATQSIVMGYGRARWISAATLDRYLQKIGQKQVFGTQYPGENTAYLFEHQRDSDVFEKFKTMSNQQTLEPYAPQIVPDSTRAAFCVPALEVQRRHISDVKAGKVKPGDLPRVADCER